ncbi:hypothetical protein BB558_006290 [Smittium angustum]|uniref:Uncharacterized protein n=1 Tax=Smittium angustum TaxID=133377 RepID=A0A2U1IY86_SMIAN|nr:hypothetical protein BB558_006290 [Smittium angustum]
MFTFCRANAINSSQFYILTIRNSQGTKPSYKTCFKTLYSSKSGINRYRGRDLVSETWILKTGDFETDVQAEIVAEEIGLPIKSKFLKTSYASFGFPSFITNFLGKRFGVTGLKFDSEKIPKFVVAANNEAVPACLYIKNKSNNKAFTEHGFSFVVLGSKNATKENIFYSKFSLPLISPNTKIGTSSHKNTKTCAVFISNCYHPAFYKMENNESKNLASDLNRIIKDFGYDLEIYLSKSTPKQVKSDISKVFKSNPDNVKLFDYSNTSIQDKNSYLKSMAEAEKVLISADNLIALSTAIELKKQVYIIGQENTSSLLRNQYQQLVKMGIAKRFYLEGSGEFGYMLDFDIDKIDSFSATSIQSVTNYTKIQKNDTAKRFAEFIVSRWNKSH